MTVFAQYPKRILWKMLFLDVDTQYAFMSITFSYEIYGDTIDDMLIGKIINLDKMLTK